MELSPEQVGQSAFLDLSLCLLRSISHLNIELSPEQVGDGRVGPGGGMRWEELEDAAVRCVAGPGQLALLLVISGSIVTDGS